MWIQGDVSRPPASNTATVTLGSADSLLATTHPAEPAPTTMKSKADTSTLLVAPKNGTFYLIFYMEPRWHTFSKHFLQSSCAGPMSMQVLGMTDVPRLPTNIRPLLILEVLAEADQALSPAEIGRRVGLAKQTAHRLCQSLVEDGFLALDDKGRKLRIGRRGRVLGAGLLHGQLLHVARHQILVSVAQTVGESVIFVVPEETGMIYVDRVETDWPFRIQLPVGSHVPFHCTASGKTYLASLPLDQRRRLVEALTLSPETPNTHTDVAGFLAALEDVENVGYAIDNEEFFDGMVALAVPILDPNGTYAASLAFHGPCPRMSVEKAVAQLPVLVEAAAKLKAVVFQA